MPFTEKDIPHLALVNAQGKGWYHTYLHVVCLLFIFYYLFTF